MLRKLYERKVFILAFVCFILVLIHIYFSKNMTLPIVLDDEFGYLANAAYFAGYNWSRVVCGIPYYGFGYSLLLIPFFVVNHDPYAIYKSAIMLNSFIASGVFFVSYQISKIIAPGIAIIMRLLVSFAVSLYPSYVIYSKLAWSESLLVLLFWCAVYCFLCIDQYKNKSIFIISGIVIGFIYMVHPRTLGIVVAGALVIGMAVLFKILKLKQFLFFLSGLIPMLFLGIIIKGHLVSNMWLNSSISNTNTPLGSLYKLSALLTPNGIEKLFLTTLGQFYYLGSASILLFYIGLIVTILLFYSICRLNSYAELKNKIGLAFMLLSMIFLFGTSVLSMYLGERADMLLYGRYNELFIGPFIFIGLIFVTNKMENFYSRKIIISFSFLIYFFISVLSYLLIQPILFGKAVNAMAITGIFPYRGLNWSIIIDSITINVLILFILLIVLLKIKPYLGICFVIIAFMWISFDNLNGQLFIASKDRQEKAYIAEEIINSNVNVSEIYYQSNDSYLYLFRELYQFLMPDKRIVPKNLDNIATQNLDGYLISEKKDIGTYKKGAKMLSKINNELYLWVFPGEVQNELIKKGIDFIGENKRETSITSLPLEAYKSNIIIINNKNKFTIKHKILDQLYKYRLLRWTTLFTDKAIVEVTNISNYTWTGDIKLGVFWVSADNPDQWLSEYRVDIPQNLTTGQSILVEVPLRSDDLPFGNYEVGIGMVHEGVTWFFSKGDELSSINVIVQ